MAEGEREEWHRQEREEREERYGRERAEAKERRDCRMDQMMQLVIASMMNDSGRKVQNIEEEKDNNCDEKDN